MSSNVVSLRAGPPDPLAELFAERERLGAELQRFAVVDERRAAADAKLADIGAALGALDRADMEAIGLWADSAESEPPAPLLDERKALLARRIDAEAERQAADVAVAAVAAKRTGLIVEMNRIGMRIRERQLAAALDEGRRIHTEALKIADDLAAKLQRLMGLRVAVVNMTTEAARRNDADHGRALNAALGEIDRLGRPDLVADPATVEAHTARWLEALR